MTQRLGIYSLRKTAQTLCKFIVKFSPGLRAVYGQNVVLMAALEAALAACGALDEALAEEETPGV